jgi:hypothetical protein
LKIQEDRALVDDWPFFGGNDFSVRCFVNASPLFESNVGDEDQKDLRFKKYYAIFGWTVGIDKTDLIIWHCGDSKWQLI